MVRELQKEPWIMVRDGSQLKLLAREGNAFLLIWVNDALSLEKEEALIRRGSVSALILEEIGLKFQTVTDVRGVALAGTEAGDAVTLYLKKGKKKLILEDDYTAEVMDDLFAGVERLEPPKPKRKNVDWRSAEQSYRVLEKMKRAAWGVNLAAFVCALAYLFTSHWLFLVGQLAALAIAVWLDIAYPAYFGFIDALDKKNGNYADLSWTLISVVLLLFDSRFGVLDLTPLLTIAVVCGCVFAFVMRMWAREVRENPHGLISVVLIGLCGSMILAETLNEALCFDPPQIWVVEVTDLHRHRRDRDCTVRDDQGKEYRIDISTALYNQLEIGEQVRMLTYSGGLGMPYAEIKPME